MRTINPNKSTREDWDQAWGGEFYREDSPASSQACNDRAKYISQILREFSITPKVLADIGCGNGMFAQSLLECYPNASMVMIDWSRAALDIAQKRLSRFQERCIFIQQDASELNTPIAADVFCSMGVIEHYTNPLAELNTLVRQMPDGANLVLMTPNSRSLVVLSRLILQFTGKWALGLQREYNVHYLEKICQQAGLKVIHKEALLRRKIPEDGLLGKSCNYIDHIIARFIPQWGWYSFVFAKKI